VPKNVDQPLLYTPPSGHPRDPPLGHPPRPTLYRAPMCPPSGTRPLSVGHPPGCRLPYSPTEYRGRSVRPFRRAIPSGIEFISFASLLTIVFIHFQESSSTDHKMHPLSKKLITCSEISSSVQKVHLLCSKFILCLPNSSTMPFLE
jgi:hypothetical protein